MPEQHHSEPDPHLYGEPSTPYQQDFNRLYARELLTLQHERTKTPDQSGPESTIPGATMLTDILDQDAAQHPEAWSKEEQAHLGRPDGAGLRPEDAGVTFADRNNRTHPERVSSRTWVVEAYGSRWAQDGDSLVLETTPLERLPELHDRFIAKVLIDEHSRPAKFINQAQQKRGKYTPDDIQLWLEGIHEGYSPIMATGKQTPDGKPEYIPHDYTDWHTATNLLWGREIQDRVTAAAGYELERRATGNLQVPQGRNNGVDYIDQITCSDQQIGLIDYAMHGPGNSPKERMAALWQSRSQLDRHGDSVSQKWKESDYLDPEVASLFLAQVGDQVAGLENFIHWYESDGKHQATPEQIEIAQKEAVIGLTRVAEKLLGTYDGTDLNLDSEPEIPDQQQMMEEARIAIEGHAAVPTEAAEADEPPVAAAETETAGTESPALTTPTKQPTGWRRLFRRFKSKGPDSRSPKPLTPEQTNTKTSDWDDPWL